MTETGRIREIRENIVIIAPDKTAACFGCMNHECKSGSGFISAENHLTLNLKTGQLVEVSAPGSSVFAQAAAVFLPPVLSFIAGYVLAGFVFHGTGEGAAVGTGFVFLFVSTFVVYKSREKKSVPMVYTVKRIID